MTHPFHLSFYGPDEEPLGAVESPVVPSVGDRVGPPHEHTTRAVTAVQWTFAQPGTPAHRDGRVALIHVLLGEDEGGIFAH